MYSDCGRIQSEYYFGQKYIMIYLDYQCIFYSVHVEYSKLDCNEILYRLSLT